MMLLEFKNKEPSISETSFVAGSADIIGDVKIGEGSSVWFNATIRGDKDEILVGKKSSIQDNCVIHTDPPFKVKIGNNVSIGHGAILHGCTIGNNVLVGMNSTVLDGAEVGKNCIIGANALIPPGKIIPPNSVVTGVPGKVRREATVEDVQMIAENAAEYVRLANEYRTTLNE
jgi:carbonic anhydrase/acetyltransferase-like protein (isoleucine patch superfamily)